MNQYIFTCPIQGCAAGMTVDAQTKEHGREILTGQAITHLSAIHPDIHKTYEEVRADIAAAMTEIKK